MKEIGYITDICKPYCDGIMKSKTLDDLKVTINEWKELSHDALLQVESPGFNWAEYLRGARRERRGKYAGDAWAEKYGAILLPAVIMQIGLIGQHFVAPDGCVLIRMIELGTLIMDEDGFYYLQKRLEE